MAKEKKYGLVIGRPTKYKPEYCQMLIEHMSQGYSFESFGGLVSVNRDTLYEWADKHPKFSDAQQIGKLKRLLAIEYIGLKGLKGQILLDEKTGEISKPNAVIYQLYAKNVLGFRDSPIDTQDKPKSVITLNYKLDDLKDDNPT